MFRAEAGHYRAFLPPEFRMKASLDSIEGIPYVFPFVPCCHCQPQVFWWTRPVRKEPIEAKVSVFTNIFLYQEEHQ